MMTPLSLASVSHHRHMMASLIVSHVDNHLESRDHLRRFGRADQMPQTDLACDLPSSFMLEGLRASRTRTGTRPSAARHFKGRSYMLEGKTSEHDGDDQSPPAREWSYEVRESFA
jgi:hypothetical protein